MLNIRLYDDPEKMLEIEGSREEILRSFFNEMVEEKNFNIAFCEWFKKKYYFFRIGNYYACANDDLVQQVLRLEELIKNKGYSIYELKLEEIEKIIKQENELEELLDELTDKEIEEVLETKEILNKMLNK